ncbi:DUF1007 family protein [Treponema sp.]
MFLSSQAEFVWEGAKLSGCYLEWTFDKFFSADIIQGFDTNGDGKFNRTETDAIYNKAFSNLKKYYYFTFIRQGKERTNPPSVSQFTARQEKGSLIYRFFIDLSKAAPGELNLAVYDYTFFCDIRSSETHPVKLSYDPSLVQPSFEIVENKEYPVYYNPLGAANDNSIYYTWKKGLETYYPREIKISYAP